METQTTAGTSEAVKSQEPRTNQVTWGIHGSHLGTGSFLVQHNKIDFLDTK